MIGIELDRPCGELVKQALEQGLLINVTVDNVVRLLPPLVIQARGGGAAARDARPAHHRGSSSSRAAPQPAAQTA